MSAAAPKIEVLTGLPKVLKESNSLFTCPGGEVLTGRSHQGDENGWTTYWCGRILIDGEPVLVQSEGWSYAQKESSSYFVASGDQALIGRAHYGDENGMTQYLTATLHWRGSTLRVTSRSWGSFQYEHSHSINLDSPAVLTGRTHQGDERGRTNYEYGILAVGG